MKKISKVKVAVFHVADQYTRENICTIISMYPVSANIEHARAFFNEFLAGNSACVTECKDLGTFSPMKAQKTIDTFRRENLYTMVLNLINVERIVA